MKRARATVWSSVAATSWTASFIEVVDRLVPRLHEFERISALEPSVQFAIR